MKIEESTLHLVEQNNQPFENSGWSMLYLIETNKQMIRQHQDINDLNPNKT